MALFSAAARRGSRVSRFVPTLSSCAAGLLLAGAAVAGSNTFTSVGPHGGTVYRLAWHPTDSSIVYATATSGFHRSTDGGATWHVINDRIYNQARDIAVNPAHANNVFTISPSSGVLSSDDSGATLTVLSTFPSASTGLDIEYSADGSMLYASNGLRVYRSSNQGDVWVEGGSIPGVTSRTSPTLAVDPTNATTLYITGDVNEGAQSTDGGATWQPWPVPTGQVSQIAIVNTQPLRIWAASTTGTWFTDDRGQHWSQAHTSFAQAVSVDPSDSDVVYIGTYEGLYRSDNN